MTDTTLDEIEQELAALDQAYQDGFAGQDRSSVDASKLPGLIGRATEAMAKLEKLGALTAGDNAATLLKGLEERRALYQREQELIAAAKSLGGNFERFGVEGSSANFAFDRYQRHFAGQGRDTRDLGLIKELVEELKQVRKRMQAIGGKGLPEALARDVELVSQNIERYALEEREIPKAQASGTPEEQADRLAFLANQQFAIYQAFFAGQARISRRPGLLVRVVDNLKRYRAAMFDLKNRGLSSESNVGNIGVVDGRLKAYEAELVEIRKVRQQTKLVDLMGVLGGSANDLFEEYRRDFAGKDRTSVSLEQLSFLLDRLDELRRQMEDLGRVEKNETNAKNAAIVREYQANWVREFQAVRSAQAAKLATAAT